jgi:Zn-dependent peptidase ImmA (M78 family)/transcriptional regulator with XRE-family HTH domain
MSLKTSGFISERLKEAREARGLSITSLADLTELSKQSISGYEKGTNPSITALTRISEKLNVPMQFFYKTCPARDNNPIFFRSLSAATKRVRTRAERRLHWLEEVIEYLGRFIYFRPVKVPIIDVGNDPNMITMNDIENIAKKCRRDWGLGDGPIHHMISLLESQGAIVARDKLDSEALDSFSKWYAQKDIPIIILSADNRSGVRCRLDVAHELGHLIIHRNIDKLGSYLKLIEEQAFRFASAFLLPAESFTKDFVSPNLDIFVMIKPKWKVSVAAMIRRCYDLNIIDDGCYSRLFINYNKRGWRKTEPLDNRMLHERPIFLRKCIEMIIEKNIQSREDIVLNLLLPSFDMEDMLELPRKYLSGESSVVEPLPQLKKLPNSGNANSSVIQFSQKKKGR